MQQQQQQHQAYKEKQKDQNKFKNTTTEGNETEEIIDEVIDLPNRASNVNPKGDPLASSDNNAISGGISSSGANAIDHSIDTL